MKTKTKEIRAERRKKAQESDAERNELTIQQKLALLPPNGANKQRARYLAQLEQAKNSPVVTEQTSDGNQNQNQI